VLAVQLAVQHGFDLKHLNFDPNVLKTQYKVHCSECAMKLAEQFGIKLQEAIADAAPSARKPYSPIARRGE